jgi:branched-chain amino acid transport system permease protein
MVRDILRNLAALGWPWRIFVILLVSGTVLFYFLGSPYYQSLFLAIAMYVVLCSSWNIISGITGYVSFGHVAFWGLGAYVTAVLIVKLDFPWPLALLCSGLLTGVFAALISYPILKLSEVYFAISMLALAETVKILVGYFRGLTGGGGGIYLPPLIRPNLAFLLMTALALVIVLMTFVLRDTKFFKSLMAIKNNELAAGSLGIDTTRRKTQAFILSAVFPALAGGIYILNVAFIDPKTAFDIGITLNTIMMTVFGGLGTILGPVIGPAVFMLLSETLWARFPFVHKAILGAIIVLLVIFLPRGILSALSRAIAGLRSRSRQAA